MKESRSFLNLSSPPAPPFRISHYRAGSLALRDCRQFLAGSEGDAYRSFTSARSTGAYSLPRASTERVARAVDEGSFDVRDLGRRARRVLEKTAKPAEPEQLF